MKRRRSQKPQPPSVDDLDQHLVEALQPGMYLAPDEVTSMLWSLEVLEREVRKLGTTEPDRAEELYEGMIGACVEKLDELEYDGEEALAVIIGDMFAGWIGARQAASEDAGETAATLLRWERKIDRDLPIVDIAARTLDEPGVAAYVRGLRQELAWAREAAAREAEKARPAGSYVCTGDVGRAAALRRFLVVREDVAALTALCEAPGALAEDCYALVELLEERDELAQALVWAERGVGLLEPGGEDDDEEDGGRPVAIELSMKRRDLLVQLGRGEEALADAWTAFERDPCDLRLEEVLELAPDGEEGPWLARAAEAVAGKDLRAAVGVWLRAGAFDRVVAAMAPLSDAMLEATSRHVLERAAEEIETTAPELAGRLYRAMGWRTLARGRGRSNAQAVEYFEGALRCWRAAGRLDAWDELLAALREHHGRKKALLGDVLRLAAKKEKPKGPSLLERGRARLGEA